MNKQYINLGRNEKEKEIIARRVITSEIIKDIESVRLQLLKLKERVKVLNEN